LSETITLRDIHPKFVSIVKQLYTIQQNDVKCRVFINFGASEEEVSFRYEHIDPVELNKLAQIINKEKNGINE